jgi:hypothetical protein
MAFFFLILGLIIFFVAAYLLFAPFYVEIDTYHQLYRVRLHRLASAGLAYADNRFVIRFTIAGWTKDKLLEDFGGSSQKVKMIKRGDGKPPGVKKLQAMAASFRVTKFRLKLDTGDMQMNGILFPLFYWINAVTGRELQISFCGGSGLVLQIQNRLSGLLWAYIRN